MGGAEGRGLGDRRARRHRAAAWWAFAAAGFAAAGVLARAEPLPPVPSPPENPASEAKRVLGKILFWDEQLSADDTISCGTCHLPSHGGADARRARHPGTDGVFNTPDDAFGSPGVVHRDAEGNFVPHATFGLDPQVTGRTAPSALTGALADSLFWDGRASGRFVDPQTSLVAVGAHGGLESQAVGPPLSAAEMGREGRTWDDVAAKLAAAAPLALASDLPPDVAAALGEETRYPDLFAAAFGDGAVTSQRIAFAIAAYERTLVPDQTPFDRFTAGDPSALSAAQVRGLNAFQASHCAECHAGPAFTDGTFRNIGLRPPAEDTGRQGVTGAAADRGKFKVPSLRGVGRRSSFMHGGQFTTLTDVLRFYARAPGTTQFTDNRDPVMPQINLPANAAADVQALLAGGLDDPRATAGTFPFDRPTLYSERRDHGPSAVGAGRPGTGGVAPRMVAPMPAYLGNSEFRLGIGGGLAGAVARLVVSKSPPAGAELSGATLVGQVTLLGQGTAGYGTVAWPVPAEAARDGEDLWFQWRVDDPSATGGVALSPAASVELFAVRGTPPLVTGDERLFASSADLTIDWRRHAKGAGADSFSLRSVLNAAGTSGAEGAQLTIALGGEDLFTATLDAAGRAKSARGAAPAWTARWDAATGRLTAGVSGLDLRSITGLDEHEGAGELTLPLRVALTGAGLAAGTADAIVPFAWRTREARSTTASYRYARDGLGSGAFRPQGAEVRLRPDGTRSVRIDGALDPAGTAAFDPAGDVTVRAGGATIVFPAASKSRSFPGGRETIRYSFAAGAQSARLVLDAAKRTFSFAGDGLSADVLPDGAATEASLLLSVESQAGAVRSVFTTEVGLRRRSPKSRTWTD